MTSLARRTLTLSACTAVAIGAITNLAPIPGADWTDGAGLAAAGNGYAEADPTEPAYGAILIRSVSATCDEGDASVRIYGTDGSVALAAGRSVQFAGTRVSVGSPRTSATAARAWPAA